jgi:hypothetical protein
MCGSYYTQGCNLHVMDSADELHFFLLTDS